METAMFWQYKLNDQECIVDFQSEVVKILNKVYVRSLGMESILTSLYKYY